MIRPAALPPGFLDRPFAHRGLHGPGAPENSLPAVGAAISAGYGIELDLQPSAEGHPMVFHDDTLDRMTDHAGPLARQSTDDLSRMQLFGGVGAIPRLDAVLAEVRGRVPLLLELKDQSGGLAPARKSFEPALARLLTGYDGPVAVMSFNPDRVAALAALLPDVPRGLTSCAFAPQDWPHLPPDRTRALAELRDAQRVGASFVSHDHKDLQNPAIARCRAEGRKVLCWTIRSPEEEARARRDVDQITFEHYLPR